MNPGATARPSASMMRGADALNLPTPTIFPWCTATSAWNDGPPEPSTTRPFLMSRSYAIGLPPLGPAPFVRRGHRGGSPPSRSRDPPAALLLTQVESTPCTQGQQEILRGVWGGQRMSGRLAG